jgi:sodium-dependent phosphate cotransporter
MGGGFKGLGKGFSEALLTITSNWFVGLFIGVLATSLIQSSSTTTSMVVIMVAAETLDVRSAIPIIMGANIGTSVTNTAVSLGHITRRNEFRRAFAAATVHDFFNIMAVMILLPLEYFTHILEKSAYFLAGLLTGGPAFTFTSPLKAITKPVFKAMESGLIALTGSKVAASILLIALGLVALIAALIAIVKVMRTLLARQLETALNRVLGKSAIVAMVVGMFATAIVQSSSVTTSLLVPLAGAGLVTLSGIFPVTLGANVGTTVTALLAAMSTIEDQGVPPGLVIALCHFLFNVTGILLIYPVESIRRIPMALAEWLGDLCAESRRYAFVYIAVVFFLVPITLITITNFSDVRNWLGL